MSKGVDFVNHHIKSTLEQLSTFKHGSSNVFLLIKTHEDNTGRIEDVIELTFALVSGFDRERGSVIYEQFKLIFNKKEVQQLYPNISGFYYIVLSKILKQYTEKEIDEYLNKTRKGIIVGTTESIYVDLVSNMSISHRQFLENTKQWDFLAAYFMIGNKFQNEFTYVKTTKSQDILLKAIKLAAVGAISIAALRKLFTLYESKSRKTPSTRHKTKKRVSKTSKRRHK